MKSYNKLVRDKIPAIIEENNEKPVIRVLDDDEYKEELKKKLFEEIEEYLNAETIRDRSEELADVLEVVFGLASIDKLTKENITELANEKRTKRGGFVNRIYLEDVIENGDDNV